MRANGFYVTGTDTGIGKTAVSAGLLVALRAHGLRATGMKPVASGCVAVREADGATAWRNADALALLEASDPAPVYADLNPYALPLPLAPELAARDAGIAVTLPPLLAARRSLSIEDADATVTPWSSLITCA